METKKASFVGCRAASVVEGRAALDAEGRAASVVEGRTALDVALVVLWSEVLGEPW